MRFLQNTCGASLALRIDYCGDWQNVNYSEASIDDYITFLQADRITEIGMT
jgi:hypothetical protein